MATPVRGARAIGNALADITRWLVVDAKAVSVVVVFFLFALYFAVNAPRHLGTNLGELVKSSSVVYLLMVLGGAVLLMILGIQFPLLDLSLGKFLLIYAGVFLVGSLVLAATFQASGFHPPEIPHEASTNWVLFSIIFLIAFPEELFFRDFIPAILQHFNLKNAFAAQVIGAALFSIWHGVAYQGGGVGPFVFAFIAGIIFGLVRENFFAFDGTRRRTSVGLAIAIALHSVYNAAVFGVFCLTCDGDPFGFMATIIPAVHTIEWMLPTGAFF